MGHSSSFFEQNTAAGCDQALTTGSNCLCGGRICPLFCPRKAGNHENIENNPMHSSGMIDPYEKVADHDPACAASSAALIKAPPASALHKRRSSRLDAAYRFVGLGGKVGKSGLQSEFQPAVDVAQCETDVQLLELDQDVSPLSTTFVQSRSSSCE